VTSGAEARGDKKAVIAALKALHPSTPKPGLLGIPVLRHPKSGVFSSLLDRLRDKSHSRGQAVKS